MFRREIKFCHPHTVAGINSNNTQSFFQKITHHGYSSTATQIQDRIIQELLNNILKHAPATEVKVQVIRDEGRMNIVVEDNGKGFDPNSLDEKKVQAG
jgi:signal transduction histidine kinase